MEFGLLSILAAFGAAFGILYMALTIKLGSGRRKRRSEAGTCDAGSGTISGYYGCHLHNFVFGGEEGSHWQQAADLLWHGKHHPLGQDLTLKLKNDSCGLQIHFSQLC